jgi:hypothetical protein
MSSSPPPAAKAAGYGKIEYDIDAKGAEDAERIVALYEEHCRIEKARDKALVIAERYVAELERTRTPTPTPNGKLFLEHLRDLWWPSARKEPSLETQGSRNDALREIAQDMSRALELVHSIAAASDDRLATMRHPCMKATLAAIDATLAECMRVR